MTATAGYEDSDEWELVNDDGFVHKRKKRPRFEPTAASQPPDPGVERKLSRERKRRALVKLRNRYLKEIRHWELLSNTLNEMEHNAHAQPLECQELRSTTSFDDPSSSEEHSASNSTFRRLVGDLLYQVEAQEAVIQNVSNLCEVAQTLCNAQEERMKHQFINLPIWETSPNDLMAALVEQ
ncbi:hypothetical protein BUALT_Bualt04G0164400 [Buddleja alternifolia]|uniref:Uncharacterized protein n=1 Tax=Buddleja alternifolia TaxID=168488 RepID=A0AAV6XPG6_9LAMI|nr:hypothetical protein BUALT_Bualt04G0164400 [Buddleja alternifolia]